MHVSCLKTESILSVIFLYKIEQYGHYCNNDLIYTRSLLKISRKEFYYITKNDLNECAEETFQGTIVMISCRDRHPYAPQGMIIMKIIVLRILYHWLI